MNKDKQRLAMAALDGIKNPVYRQCITAGHEMGLEYWDWFTGEGQGTVVIPTYEELGDVQRVFMTLTKEQKIAVMRALPLTVEITFEATPAQWRQGILKELGKWTEG